MQHPLGRLHSIARRLRSQVIALKVAQAAGDEAALIVVLDEAEKTQAELSAELHRLDGEADGDHAE